ARSPRRALTRRRRRSLTFPRAASAPSLSFGSVSVQLLASGSATCAPAIASLRPTTGLNTHATDTPIDQEQPAPGAGGAGAAARPKVLYVLGAGRSGSTILGVALGNCDGVFFAGELNKWLAQSGAPSLKDAPRVEFWSTVREQVTAAAGLFGHQTSCLERSSALFKVGN